MYRAAEKNSFDVAELLIRSGANVNIEGNVSSALIMTYLVRSLLELACACGKLHNLIVLT